jgi:two-component system OmpR family response regulator
MKVLVAEDNPRLARFLARALGEDGYVVDLVTDGGDVLRQASVLAYDVVVLDWMLPGLDGLAVCRELRARGQRVPILMLSARGDVSERILALDAGVDDYLPKPFDLGELLARLRALLRRSSEPGGVIRVGPLCIDRANRRVTLDGEKIDLTHREFLLLAHLAREAGRTVSRTELLSKVWDMNFDPGSNVIEVHVKNLRDKLGVWSGMVATVRGKGYELRLP